MVLSNIILKLHLIDNTLMTLSNITVKLQAIFDTLMMYSIDIKVSNISVHLLNLSQEVTKIINKEKF